MSGMIEYKCPKCGGGVNFDAAAQKMKCPYCDTIFDVEAVKSLGADSNQPGDSFNWEVQAGQEWEPGEEEGMRVYTCKSCGGQIVGDENLGSSKCPYCDNPVVMTGQFSGALKPDYVIPFKVQKKAAQEAFKEHLLGKKLLPKEFKDENRIEEIKGIYVPFWLFDTELDAAINYKGTNIRTWSDDDYDYTEYSYYHIARAGEIAFETIPVDGSSKMPNDLMESLEPFDFNEAVPFNTGYLAGYAADKYDVDVDGSIDTINRRVKNSTEEAFRSTVRGYDMVDVEFSSVQLRNSEAKYALYPVWIMNVTWNQKPFMFAMNGQTGKFVGNLPVDEGAARAMFLKWFGILGVGLGALASVAMFLI